jgi:hypothetical protein
MHLYSTSLLNKRFYLPFAQASHSFVSTDRKPVVIQFTANVMDDVIIPVPYSANDSIASKVTITAVNALFFLSAVGIVNASSASAVPATKLSLPIDAAATETTVTQAFIDRGSSLPTATTDTPGSNPVRFTSDKTTTLKPLTLDSSPWAASTSADFTASNEQVSINHSNIVLNACSDDASCDQTALTFVPLAADPVPQDSEIAASEPEVAPTPPQNSISTPPTPIDSASLVAQTEQPSAATLPEHSTAIEALGSPSIRLQGVYLQEGDEASARARITGMYAPNTSLLFGITVDAVTGDAFTDSEGSGLDLNELYVAASPPSLPGLRAVFGMIDLTSYFDRNSFAKDAATHFFNPVFQTNPALSVTGIGSRPGALVAWNPIDNLSLTGATFSSSRDLGEFQLDGFAGEVGVRFGNVIVRGTYATDRDAGQDDGFEEIYQISRNGGEDFGLRSGDREVAYGLNIEAFIPEISLGLFGRYGWYENQSIDQGGQTYSLGFNLLDLLLPSDRLGLGYGRELSNNRLRRRSGTDMPDVWELFYDTRLTRNLRAGISLQARDQFSETVLGFRVRADINSDEIGRLFR